MWRNEGTVRRQVRRLTTAGNYAAAVETVQQHQLQREAELAGALESLAKDAAGQWNSLQRTKAQSLMLEESRALSAEQTHLRRLEEAHSVRQRRSVAALTRFSTVMKDKLNAAPLNTPADALALRDQETRFTLQGSFAAAAQSRRDAARAEHDHICASFVERGTVLDRRVSRQATALSVKEAAALQRDQFNLTMLRHRHAEEQQRARWQARHLEDGMLAAQRRTQQQILKMRRTGDVSRAALAAAHRGATLERRVYGDAYRVPSLCELYGPLLDQPASALPAL